MEQGRVGVGSLCRLVFFVLVIALCVSERMLALVCGSLHDKRLFVRGWMFGLLCVGCVGRKRFYL